MNIGENVFEMIVCNHPDAIIFADTKGTIRIWNLAAERIFGFSQEQAIGSSLDIIIPKALLDAHHSGFEHAMREGRTKHVGKSLPTKSLHADGSTIYVELGFSIVLDSAGNVIGALSSARDITEKYRQERASRKSKSERDGELD